jgi:hypothetical protein
MPSYAEHRLDVYGTALFLATTKKQWRAIAKRLEFVPKHVPQCSGQATFAVWEPDNGNSEPVVVLWINTADHTSTGELIDTCAHEASHAAGRILEHIGHPIPATDEPHAYLIGWLTRWIWEHSGDDE